VIDRLPAQAETAEQTMLREAVAVLAAKYGHRHVQEQSGRPGQPDPLWDDLRDSGFIGVNVSTEHGGGGCGVTELSIVSEELAAAGCPSMMTVVSGGLCVPLIETFGTDAQKARWLPDLARGAAMAFALTESDAGSNTHAITTTASRHGDRWVVRGEKVYTSGLEQAANVLVVARVAADAGSGLSMFIVPVDAPGLDKRELATAVDTSERQYVMHLDDVAVDAGSLLGEVGAGLKQLFVGLTSERIMAASLCNGLARYCLDKAVTYANEREVWGRPIGAHQGIAHPIAEAAIDLEAARTLTWRAAASYDAGVDAGFLGDAAKHLAARAAARSLDVAVQTHGGNGLAYEYGLAHLWGLVRLYSIAPVSKEMVLSAVAHRVLGLPKSS
jgi:alkylation response protein AidB-like acyl-CoA dehydrogenase